MPEPASAATVKPDANGWRLARREAPLADVYRSIRIPVCLNKGRAEAGQLATSIKKFAAFAGPGYLVAVGYMDPGNWATAIAGGSKFGYALLWVRRLSTRAFAVIPAAFLSLIYGRGSTGPLLLASQVSLALQLPFAVLPLIHITSSKSKMGALVAPRWLTGVSLLSAGLIILLGFVYLKNSLLA